MFGVKPSSYFPELGTYEAFCLDEAVAYHLAMEEKRQFDEVKAEKETGGGTKSNRPRPTDDNVSILQHEAFRKKD